MTVLENPWIPHDPHPKQAEFLLLPHREAFYGGAAGGGKSEALLMGALQYVQIPNFTAILFRKTYADLSLPGALMDRAAEWLQPTAARWNQTEKTWTFPSGAKLTFGYMDTKNDRFRYQSSEMQYCGFDELTHFQERDYRYMFSRLRRVTGMNVPIRMRAASNPGGVGHQWVKQRFLLEGRSKGRPFIPARKVDNPSLDEEDYRKSLAELDPVERKRLDEGDWEVTEKGELFDRAWFKIVRMGFGPDVRRIRYWDLAATKPKQGKDPDWTAGALVAGRDGEFCIEDMKRDRDTPGAIERLVKRTAQQDGIGTVIWIEQEPGASGVNTIDHYRRTVLPEFAVYGDTDSGPKPEFWRVLSSKADNGLVSVVEGEWNGDFFDELEALPGGDHDDQADASSKGLVKLTRGRAPDESPVTFG